MLIYTTKKSIKDALIDSMVGGDGIYVKSYPTGKHKYWLTGDEESYIVHCYGSGQNWRDQSDGFSIQNIDELVNYLWDKRARIIEIEF